MTDASALSYREINSLGDASWPEWLEIYLSSFPKSERMTVGYFEGVLQEKSRGDAQNKHPLVLFQRDRVAGIAYYEDEEDSELSFLWYLAISEECRNGGIGSWFYHELIKLMKHGAIRMCVFEVEIPTEPGGFADRRLNWYKRQGAKALEGVRYLQEVDSGVEPTPMILMIHPLLALTTQEAFSLAAAFFPDTLKVTGTVELR